MQIAPDIILPVVEPDTLLACGGIYLRMPVIPASWFSNKYHRCWKFSARFPP
jgi:hypothetical protein